MALSIGADVRRIFDALTVPEYQEAWICMPDQDSNCHLAAVRMDQSFRIDRYSNRGIDVSIVGCYRVCRRSKLHFTWQKNGPAHTPASLVQIRLHGDFGSSILHLLHSGLASTAEYIWHREMWEASLARLASLF
jgi:uncharacterized protein YndB with AHSA1/START domain